MAVAAIDSPGWIGPRPSAPHAAAVMYVGVIGIMIAGVSLVVTDADARGAIAFGAAGLAAAMAIVTALHLRPAKGRLT